MTKVGLFVPTPVSTAVLLVGRNLYFVDDGFAANEMRNHLFERLVVVRDEFDAAQSALKLLQDEWSSLHTQISKDTLGLEQVRQALYHLEETYLMRVWAVFEGVLRADLARLRPNKIIRRISTELIVNGVASRRNIPDELRENVHLVRVYRNSLVHPTETQAEFVSFRDTLSFLNHFLAWLPDL